MKEQMRYGAVLGGALCMLPWRAWSPLSLLTPNEEFLAKYGTRLEGAQGQYVAQDYVNRSADLRKYRIYA
jgi:hypothetical protein